VVGVVLAAGRGTRLRPLNDIRPKALCPVDNVALVDLAISRLAAVAGDIAVNVHHHRDQMEAHLGRRVHLSVEERGPLGTAGALAALREWIAGRPVVAGNADAWLAHGIDSLLGGWDGRRVRLLAVAAPAPSDFGPRRYAGACLLPWSQVATLRPEPSSLYDECWAPSLARRELDFVDVPGPFIDCGTPLGYLSANLAASGGRSVVGEGAVVEGELVRSVVWPDGYVARGEGLVECIRVGASITVPAGGPARSPG